VSMTSQDRKALDQPEPGHGTLPALSEADMEVGLVRRLLTVVSAWPDRLAVIDPAQSLTYADLAGRAGAVAEALRDVGPLDQPVVMLSQHNAPAIATIIGALLSGHPLLVMDPLTPAPRLRGFAERLGASVCLTDAANEALATEVISGVGGRALRSPAEAPGPDWTTSPIWQTRLDPFRPAVLGFTSGSTGRPKVVEMNERYLVGDAWAGSTATGIAGAGDVMAHTLPLAFAAGMNVSLTGPLAGATLAMYDTRTLGIAGLADWIETAGVTMMAASPAILRAFVNGGPDPRKLRGLRRLSLSGEAAYGRDVDLARTVVPSTCWVHHRLGSTETGLISEFMADASTPIPDGRLSVGAPTGITRAELVDEEGRLVPVGQPGRLIITRSYLSTGYWGDPERTAEAFWDNGDGTCSFRTNDLGRFDESGQLFLLGRSDHSVKVRGYLVEPGEVDAVLFTLPDVAEAVTVGLPRADGLTYRLVAYVVSRAEKPNAAAIRASLREALPSHMVPETVVFLTALPRTERGKLDRSVLPAPPPIPSAEGEDAFTDWEEAIAEVWGRALAMDLDDVSRHADFFELGGDSLAAEQVISMVINDLQVPPEGVTASILIEAPT
jgi:acyl-coenzyme A synthetase/AMP-(fatty) acid ligase